MAKDRLKRVRILGSLDTSNVVENTKIEHLGFADYGKNNILLKTSSGQQINLEHLPLLKGNSDLNLNAQTVDITNTSKINIENLNKNTILKAFFENPGWVTIKFTPSGREEQTLKILDIPNSTLTLAEFISEPNGYTYSIDWKFAAGAGLKATDVFARVECFDKDNNKIIDYNLVKRYVDKLFSTSPHALTEVSEGVLLKTVSEGVFGFYGQTYPKLFSEKWVTFKVWYLAHNTTIDNKNYRLTEEYFTSKV